MGKEEEILRRTTPVNPLLLTPLSERMRQEEEPTKPIQAEGIGVVELSSLQCELMSPQEIKKLRMEMDLTLREFGEILGASPSTVSMWESGNRNPDKRSEAMLYKLRERVKAEGGKSVAESLLEIAGSVGGAVGFVLLMESLFGGE